MKRQKVVFCTTRPTELVAIGVMEGIGTPDFAKGLLSAIQIQLPCSHCTVFALEDTGAVTAVSVASLHGGTASATARLYIEKGFNRNDVNMRWLASKKTPKREQVWMYVQKEEDVTNPEYRRFCYTENGIRERIALTFLFVDGRRMIISFYRNLSLARFTDSDCETLLHLVPLIGAALKAHIRLTRRFLRGSLLHQRIFANLSGRERQVVSYVLAGRTMKEVAVQLGLSQTTVLTYRYRAFRSLGIRTHHELLALLDSSPPSA